MTFFKVHLDYYVWFNSRCDSAMANIFICVLFCNGYFPGVSLTPATEVITIILVGKPKLSYNNFIVAEERLSLITTLLENFLPIHGTIVEAPTRVSMTDDKVIMSAPSYIPSTPQWHSVFKFHYIYAVCYFPYSVVFSGNHMWFVLYFRVASPWSNIQGKRQPYQCVQWKKYNKGQAPY